MRALGLCGTTELLLGDPALDGTSQWARGAVRLRDEVAIRGHATGLERRAVGGVREGVDVQPWRAGAVVRTHVVGDLTNTLALEAVRAVFQVWEIDRTVQPAGRA